MKIPLSEDLDFLLTIFNAIPNPTLIVDDDIKILFYNQSAASLVTDDVNIIRKRAGEVLHCIRSIEKGCGQSEYCRDCIIRNSVNESIVGAKVYRKQATLTFATNNKEIEAFFLITTTPFNYRGEILVILSIEDISELIQLKSLIPICAKCKKIRNDSNYWESVETYIGKQLDVSFSHGICPDCVRELYPEIAARINVK
jgi:hypothetical protein